MWISREHRDSLLHLWPKQDSSWDNELVTLSRLLSSLVNYTWPWKSEEVVRPAFKYIYGSCTDPESVICYGGKFLTYLGGCLLRSSTQQNVNLVSQAAQMFSECCKVDWFTAAAVFLLDQEKGTGCFGWRDVDEINGEPGPNRTQSCWR